ncbi:MAG: DUF4389 domain-containing protein [Rhodospirillaceae bacterium]|nr:DUF4389 domain-containing protein [Rhodospirillaceae bacterium]MDD9997778.1 DUF4389 domain-containing protein [Rhodospirillaceae bacterium]
MSDAKSPSDEGSRASAPSDQPPLDHVPPDEPSSDDEAHESTGDPEARENRIAEHLTSRSSWLRLLYMVLFAALWSITRLVVLAVVILQVLFLLFSGGRNERLAGFGESLAVYSYQLVAYLTFASEEQPFPFSDWPDGSVSSEQADEEDAEQRA